MKVEWHKYNHEDKKGTAPPNDELVWVIESFYLMGPGIGTFDGFTFRMWYGSDDCCVEYWAPIEYPDYADEWAELGKEAEL
jgi:hypothetical protein